MIFQVAYPIIDIREAGLGARAFVETLEDAVISTLSERDGPACLLSSHFRSLHY